MQRTLVASFAVACVRAIFFAIKDEYLAAGLREHALRSFSRHLLESWATTLVPAFFLGWLIVRFSRSRGRWLSGALVLLAASWLGYSFLAFRLPERSFYAPAADNLRGWAANLVALTTAVAAALVLLVRTPVPARRVLAGTMVVILAGALGVVLLPGEERNDKPNLILISLDTLRRDHLGCYGYERPTTPELDRFAERSLRFELAFSPQPWTLTAHMSMLTGLYPSVHNVDVDRALPESAETLAGLLKGAGYETLGVVHRFGLMDSRFGFGRGFDYYQQITDPAPEKRRRILDLLDDAGDGPLFLFAHFFDVHSDPGQVPYEADAGDVQVLAGDFDHERVWGDEEGLLGTEYLMTLPEKGVVFEGETLAHLTSLYDAGIRSLDREIGRLLRGFEARGLFEDSVILITADHGEELFEHGQPLHSQCFDECVAVPFLLYTPWSEGGVRDELVSLVDITPTFLELAGAPAPALTQGVSLAPLTRGGSVTGERDVVLLELMGGYVGLRGEGWSLVPTRDEPLLFDTDRDPGQATDLIRSGGASSTIPDYRAILEGEAETIRALRKRIGSDQREVRMTPAQVEELRALGYAED